MRVGRMSLLSRIAEKKQQSVGKHKTNNINGNDNKLVTITGKVYKLKNLSKGRCL